MKRALLELNKLNDQITEVWLVDQWKTFRSLCSISCTNTASDSTRVKNRVSLNELYTNNLLPTNKKNIWFDRKYISILNTCLFLFLLSPFLFSFLPLIHSSPSLRRKLESKTSFSPSTPSFIQHDPRSESTTKPYKITTPRTQNVELIEITRFYYSLIKSFITTVKRKSKRHTYILDTNMC